MPWWTPYGHRTWTCSSCGHHSIAEALTDCPTCGTPRLPRLVPEETPAPAAPQRARAPRRKPAARTGTRAAKGG